MHFQRDKRLKRALIGIWISTAYCILASDPIGLVIAHPPVPWLAQWPIQLYIDATRTTQFPLANIYPRAIFGLLGMEIVSLRDGSGNFECRVKSALFSSGKYFLWQIFLAKAYIWFAWYGNCLSSRWFWKF